VTRTTELATEVYFSDAIQKAKWRLRRIPEKMSQATSFFSHPSQTFLLLLAHGISIKEARTILYVEMIKAGASQSFIKIEAVEIAMIPRRRRKTKEAMALNLYQLEPLFKVNPLQCRHWTSDFRHQTFYFSQSPDHPISPLSLCNPRLFPYSV
jgi:hypothetical protein